jgi:hypothetical protein
MTKWQRFGDGTWVNVDHVEVVSVEEQDDGSWRLTATFASGRIHPLGSHEDRDLLVDCTDALLRGEVGEHLRALTDTADEAVMAQTLDLQPARAKGRRWRFWRSEHWVPLNAADGHLEAAQPQAAG